MIFPISVVLYITISNENLNFNKMSKEKGGKDIKKAPEKTLKEKRAAKAAKREEKSKAE